MTARTERHMKEKKLIFSLRLYVYVHITDISDYFLMSLCCYVAMLRCCYVVLVNYALLRQYQYHEMITSVT